MPKLSDWTLYHRAVRDVRGEELLPLNRLQQIYPEVYEREAAKYVGREQLRSAPVEALGCGWGDVLFFSPVHPKALLDVVRASGREVPPLRFWAINAAALEASVACVLQVRPWPNGVYTPYQLKDFLPYDAETLQAVAQPSQTTLSRLQALPPEAPLLLWSDVPHVLYRGTLSLGVVSEEWC